MNVLIIGLDLLSIKIINHLKNFAKNIFGFDFDVDKTNLFFQKKIIKNESTIILEKLLKNSDIIIINTEFYKYKNILQLSPFIKSTTLVFDTSSYKQSSLNYKEILLNKDIKFLPCNFSFFPNNIVMNFDKNYKMELLQASSTFFQKINVKTTSLPITDNNLVFSKIYHSIFILDTILSKTSLNNILKDRNICDKIYLDIFFNKINILRDLKKLVDNFLYLKNDEKVLNILNEKFITKSITRTEINRGIFDKILLEKLIIKIFSFKYYVDYLNNFNFECLYYNNTFLSDYYINNKNDLGILFLLLKERINNVITFLEKEDITPSKIKHFLEK